MLEPTFNGTTKRITLAAGTTSLDLIALHSHWKIWVLSGNAECLIAFSAVGGDITKIPLYLILQNDWRIVPQAADHVLTVVNGSLETPDDSDPFVDPSGSYKIRINRATPGIAIGYSTTGSTGPSADDIAAAVRSELATELSRLLDLAKINGLMPGTDAVVTATLRTAGDVVQTISEAAGTVTVSRA